MDPFPGRQDLCPPTNTRPPACHSLLEDTPPTRRTFEGQQGMADLPHRTTLGRLEIAQHNYRRFAHGSTNMGTTQRSQRHALDPTLRHWAHTTPLDRNIQCFTQNAHRGQPPLTLPGHKLRPAPSQHKEASGMLWTQRSDTGPTPHHWIATFNASLKTHIGANRLPHSPDTSCPPHTLRQRTIKNQQGGESIKESWGDSAQTTATRIPIRKKQKRAV